MASKTFIILLVTNFIISNCQEQTAESFEDIKPENKSQEIEYTTISEEEFRTTTEVNDEERESEIEDDVNTKLDKDGSMEIVTDDTVNIVATMSEDNDIDRQITNSSYNIDIGSKVDPITVSTTTIKEDEQPSKELESVEEPEISGLRNPKADLDSKPPPLEKKTFPPLTSRSIVRSWLQDSYIRPPAGLLVPLRAEALARALAVWSDLNVPPLNLTQVLVMGYDSNGVNWRSRHNLHPSNTNSNEKTVGEALSKLLLKYQGVHTDTSVDGTMRALATAAKLVPYDSAIFVVTDQGAGDPQRLPLALRALVEKRLKVYTIWTDPHHTSPRSEEAIQELRNVSKHTEGDVMPYPLQVMDVDGTGNLAVETELEPRNPIDKQGRRGRLQSDVEMEKYDLLLVRRGGGQAMSLGVPVENGVSALRIIIEGAVEHAVLYPPNDGPQIDLYNVTSVAAFSPASRTEGLSPRDVYLIFPGSQFDMDMLSVLPAHPTKPESQAAYTGMWHLSVKCNTCDYRLCVFARAFIHFTVETNTPDSLKFRVTGPVASVRESQLVDEYGTELAKLPFNYQPMTGEEKMIEIDPIVELVADVALTPVKAAKVYAKIVGRDLKGEPFIRVSGPLNKPEVRMGRSAAITFPDNNDLERVEEFNSQVYRQQTYNDTGLPFSRATSQIVNQQGTLLTSVQIGLATKLYGSPGDRLQLHFEVTNYRDQSVRFSFGAVGELRFLTGISPTSQTVGSGQTVNVIVSLTISASSQAGVRDQIIFTAYGNEQVSIAAYVYVISPTSITDVWAPELRHTFQGTCLGRTGDDCAQYAWSATIIARDALTGILRLSSSPIGLMYNSDFVSGSRSEVVATYRATCCAPRVMINAVDAFGNANSYVVDISNYFTEAAIAAIVLGVFLAIALILLIIFLIYWCAKKRRESRELPTYNTARS